jgi:hypothetical protein
MINKILPYGIKLLVVFFNIAFAFNFANAATVSKGAFKGQQIIPVEPATTTYDDEGNILSKSSSCEGILTLSWYWIQTTTGGNPIQGCVNEDGEWDTTDYGGNPSPFGP